MLLILGVLLFLLLAVLLAAQAMRGKPYSGLLFFFAIPVVMIGYSSIQEVTFKDGVITIQKATDSLQAAPTDTAARSDLQQQLSSLTNRPTSDPTALASIARAQFALGDQSAAETNVQKALQIKPDLPEAVALKQRIDTDNALTNLTPQLVQHPNDASTKQQLENPVAQAASLQIASPKFLAHIASAKAALGDRAGASSLAGKALAIDPNISEANQMKSLAASPGARPTV